MIVFAASAPCFSSRLRIIHELFLFFVVISGGENYAPAAGEVTITR